MNIKRTINEIENLSKLLKESYVFDGCDEMPCESEDELLIDDEEGEECNSSDKISEIRTLALSGIQDYAEDVESEEYQFFKKVWLLCDKFCETDKSSDNVE
jgi:hypothetical protein